MNATPRKLLGVAAMAALLLALFAAPAQAHGNPTPNLSIHPSHKGWCVAGKAPVASAEDQPKSWLIAYTYCQPFRWKDGHQVDVLTHGATYTGDYWDWKQDPATYSYVGKTLDSGRATLDYDRIGNGGSSRPVNPAEISMATDAFVLHQLIVTMHKIGFRQINSISHSLGSGVALVESTTDYHDGIKADRLVLTGYLHRPSNPAVTAGNYPANQDPKFAAAGLDGGYLTSRPGVRGTSFHSPSSDPAVVAFDDDHKDLVSLPDLLNFLGQRGVAAGANVSNSVTVPVLVVEGQQDAIFCYDPATFDCSNLATLVANETPFYTKAKSLTIATVADSGHDLTLHRTGAAVSYGIINDWIRSN